MANDQLSVCLLFVMGEEVFSQRDPSFHYYYFRNMLFKTKHTKWGTNLTQLDYSLSTLAGEEPSSCWVTIAGVQEISVTHIHSPIFSTFLQNINGVCSEGYIQFGRELMNLTQVSVELSTQRGWTPTGNLRPYSSSTAEKQNSFIYNFLFSPYKKWIIFVRT